MEKDTLNKGYVFRGTALEFLDREINKKNNTYYGNLFTADLNGAIGYSYIHVKEGGWYSEDPKLLTPCVICVDAKYSISFDPMLCRYDISGVPLSEIKVFKTNQTKEIEDLLEAAKSNPNPHSDLEKYVGFFGGWENFKKMFMEGIKEGLEIKGYPSLK